MEEESDLLYQQFVKSFLPTPEEPPKVENELIENDDLSCKDKTLLLFPEDEDPNDPEYDIFKDLRVSDLDFDEFLQFYNQLCNNEDNHSESTETESISTKKCAEESLEIPIAKETFTQDQLLILQNQLCFHVQTLTQGWIISNKFEDQQSLSDGYKEMLLELNKPTSDGQNFMSYVANLPPSIALVSECGDKIIQDELKCPHQIALSSKSRQLFASRKDIFMFDWALPDKKFHVNPAKRFTESDDALIAFGMKDFNEFHEKNTKQTKHMLFQHIHQKFLPIHPVKCLKNRIKNLKRGPKINETDKNDIPEQETIMRKQKIDEWWSNPIIYYLRENKLPQFRPHISPENMSKLHEVGKPPDWYKEMVAQNKKVTPPKESVKSSEAVLLPKTPSIQSINTWICQDSISIQPVHDPNVNVHLEEIKRNSEIIKKLQRQKRQSKIMRAQELKRRKAELEQQQKIQKDFEVVFGETVEIQAKNDVSENSEKDDSTEMKIEPENFEKQPKESSEEKFEKIVPEAECPFQEPIKAENPKDSRGDKKESDDEEMLDNEENFEFNNELIYDVQDEDIDDDDIMDEENENVHEKMNAEDECNDYQEMMIDDENDLMALMEASTTTVSNRILNKTDGTDGSTITARKKAEILALQRESSKFILKNWTMDSDEETSRNELLINYYLKKARKLLNETEYVKFLELIVSFTGQIDAKTCPQNEQNFDQVQRFYKEIKDFLIDTRKQYVAAKENLTNRQQIIDGLQELIELLVLFLDMFQAQACNESFQYLHWRRIFDFFRKVELYLSFIHPKRNQQHGCIQKMVRSINQLVLQQQNYPTSRVVGRTESGSKIKSTISKILNNHPLLMKEFSSLFLDETPSPCFFSNDEDFDEFCIDENQEDVNDIQMGSMSILTNESDLKYGTNDCPCNYCHEHSPTSSMNETNSSHCSFCAVRFISGRIYLPQMNNKKIQLVEHVWAEASDEKHRQQLQSIDLNNSSKNDHEDHCKPKQASESTNANSSAKPAWTLAQDRVLLEACRTMILDSNITKLTEQVIEKVAINLVKEHHFDQQKSVSEISGRLLQLIEMLTSSPNV